MAKKIQRKKLKIKNENKKVSNLILIIFLIGLAVALLLFKNYSKQPEKIDNRAVPTKSKISPPRRTPESLPTPVMIEVKQLDTSSWNTYTNDRVGYSFKYPPTWSTPEVSYFEPNPYHPESPDAHSLKLSGKEGTIEAYFEFYDARGDCYTPMEMVFFGELSRGCFQTDGSWFGITNSHVFDDRGHANAKEGLSVTGKVNENPEGKNVILNIISSFKRTL